MLIKMLFLLVILLRSRTAVGLIIAKKFWIVGAFLLLLLNSIWAQDIQVSFLRGSIAKHTKNLKFDPDESLNGIEVSALYKTPGDVRWHGYWGFPQIDVSGFAIDLGDSDVLGNSYGAVAGLHFDIINAGKLRFALGLATGVSYHNRRFDLIDNPTNNAIGSHFNNSTRFRATLGYGRLSLGANLYHFSNGSVATPNLGINALMLNLGYALSLPKSVGVIEYKKQKYKREVFKHWGLDLQLVNGWTQVNTPRGPTYSVRSISLGFYKSIGPFIRMHGGLEYEYNDAIYNSLINDFQTEERARDIAYNSVVYVACELFFGNIGFRPKIGYYLPYPIEVEGTPFYIKLATHYYPIGRNKRISPYIGVALKTHVEIAQYISIQGGINF